MYLGTFTPKLLANDQLALPSKIRSQLKANRAILTTGFEKCIAGFSIPDWEKMASAELVKPLSTEEGRRVRRQVFAAAEEIDLDNQGRFVVPSFLKKYADIKNDIVVVGVGDHFEIWNKDEWDKLKNG